MPPSSRRSKKNKCRGRRFPKESTAPAAVRVENGNSEQGTPGGSQRVKKASQSLPPAGGKEIKIIFCRGVYLTENTTQAASVRFVRPWRTNRARGRLQSFCQKRALPFFDSFTPGGSVRNALRRCVRCVKIRLLPCIQKGESACAENTRLPGQSAGMDCC